jgi:hypothetical protein
MIYATCNTGAKAPLVNENKQTATPPSPPAFGAVIVSLDAETSKLWNALNELENICHRLSPLPPEPCEPCADPVDGGWIEKVGVQILELSKQNRRLGFLLNHLCKIV